MNSNTQDFSKDEIMDKIEAFNKIMETLNGLDEEDKEPVLRSCCILTGVLEYEFDIKLKTKKY